MNEAADPRVGQVVQSRYRLLGRIGRGGMGAVYEAVHVTTGKRFAVKTLLPGLGKIAEIAKRFEREARAASLLAHPNIVSVVDFGTLDDGALFLAMELVSGRSLGEAAKRPMAPERAFAILRQVLEALAAAHAEGVVHRDLKPDNIMLVDAGASAEEHDIVKLLDFGIAKLIGDAEADAAAGETLTQVGVAFGTPDYMAPEQALGEEVDGRADLYSAGVIAYELLTGGRPFVSDDKVAVLRMHVAVAPPPIDGDKLVPEVGVFLGRALGKRRGERFQTAAEMIAALDVAVAAQAATMQPSPGHDGADRASSPISPGERERRWRLAIVLLGAAALLAALIALVRGGASTTAPPGRGVSSIPPLVMPAQTLLARGDAAGAAALLEPALQGPLARDQAAWILVGRARDQLGKDADALAAYETAVSLGSTTDPALVAFVEDQLKNRPKLALRALELLPKLGRPGEQLLTEQASRGKNNAVRIRARDLAAAAGIANVDLLGSITLDLEKGTTCKERKDAVARLRALRDKRAIAPLRRARGRHGGFLNLEDLNACLDRDAAEAIDFLSALP